MNRQQFALVLALGLVGILPAALPSSSAQAGEWKTSADDSSGSTLSGKLYRNSADQNGSAPYLLLDKWGVVRGYVATAHGVDLESSVGQQVSLQGTIRTLPGGDMPYLTCEKIVGAPVEPAVGENRHSEASTVASNAKPALAMTEQPVEPETRSRGLPLREVVLEPQAAEPQSNTQYQATRPATRSTTRRVDPKRTQHTGGRAVAYQEPIPTPPPTQSGKAPHGAPEPMADPGLSAETGPMMSQGSLEPEGGVVEGPISGCENGDCASCGGESCGEYGAYGSCSDPYDAAWAPHGRLFCIGPTGLWIKADYLLWTESGMRVPALVTQGSPTDTHPGAIGQPGTTVLYGDSTINNEARSGFRLQIGAWMNRCATMGFEGEFSFLGDEVSNYHQWSDGNPMLARPFNDASLTPSQPRAELVAYPRGYANSLDGSVDVNAITRFDSAGARFLFVLCRQDGCWSDECSCASFHDRYRATFTAGYRYLDLEDQLGIYEKLTTTSGVVATDADTTVPGTLAFAIADQFSTRNSFNGGELGLKFEFQRNRWGLDLFPRVALGSTHSVVTINGSTIATDVSGARTTSAGGLLTQTTNIGTYTENSFSVVPEVDLNLSYQVTPHAKFVVGYSFLYWSNVLRAGEQIDTAVNSTTLPNSPVPPTGDTTRPQFSFVESGFWAQGLNVGLDCRW